MTESFENTKLQSANNLNFFSIKESHNKLHDIITSNTIRKYLDSLLV